MYMPVTLPQSLGHLLAAQADVVSREQALARGSSRHDVAGLLRSQHWQRVHPGVYYAHPGPVPRKAQLWAAVLKVGRGAVLSHETAAEVWGIADERSAAIHLSVRRTAGAVKPPPGVRLHYSSRLPGAEFPAAAERKVPPVTWAEEAVFDLVNTAPSAEDAVAWAIRACQRNATDPDRIRMCLDKPGHSRLKWREDLTAALTDIHAGTSSPLELRYLRGVERAHRLPEGKRRVKARNGSQVQFHDVRYTDYSVGVELDGARWHCDGTSLHNAARDNAGALDGLPTLRYGWREIAYHPCDVAREVWSLLCARGYPMDFHPCTPACALRKEPAVMATGVHGQPEIRRLRIWNAHRESFLAVTFAIRR
jgi:hypothetical protein